MKDGDQTTGPHISGVRPSRALRCPNDPGRDHSAASHVVPVEFHKDNFTVSTDRAKLDVDAIHQWLAHESYWAANIPREILDRAIANSLCFGLYDLGKFIGLARVITDYATFGYLCDVFILESHRGRGLSKWLVSCIMSHPGLKGLRRFNLVTRDAHSLYARFGFTAPANPDTYMELRLPNPYRKGAGKTKNQKK